MTRDQEIPGWDEVAKKYVWNYIRRITSDRDLQDDLFSEAQAVVFDAATNRATSKCRMFLVKSAIGAVKHFLRDKAQMIRIPAWLSGTEQAEKYRKEIVMLMDEDMADKTSAEFSEQIVEAMAATQEIERIRELLPRLAKAERYVVEQLLRGRSVRQIAASKRVRVGCIYTQKQNAVRKLKRWLGE